MKDFDYSQIASKYAAKLKESLGERDESDSFTTRSYNEFREEYMPKHLTTYEKLCNWSEKIINVKPDKKKIPVLQEAIETAHLNMTPAGAASFAILGPFIFIIVVSLFGYILTAGSMYFVVLALMLGVVIMMPLADMPITFASSWRLKASNQMVLCIFYIVAYMRHTSNLELAIDFAAEHLDPPLSLDMKKVMWNIESEKYHSLKESLENYLLSWRNYNDEFIEAIHLIESSLYETSEDRRLGALEKSLKVMLEETYEKMLHYAHNLQSPINTLHMLGIVLPILGLIILPLVVSFMGEIKWWHLATIYNLVLPAAVYYLGKSILSKRPTGYGSIDISQNPELAKYKNIIIKIGKAELRLSPIWVAGIVLVAFVLIGLSPLIIHALAPGFAENIDKSLSGTAYKIFDYRDVISPASADAGKKMGPYGFGATILSMFIPLGVGLGFGLYYKLRSKNIIKIREQSKKLEIEFASSLFQLGNRLGDGIPLEVAFNKVAAVMEDSVSGRFFKQVSLNITKFGMSVDKAIFDRNKGALAQYPSPLIESSMKVLIESSKKGPLIASQALINISEYVKDMHRVDERLKDLLADTISSMKMQINLLAPAISGIVVGITSMITSILGSLTENIKSLNSGSDSSFGLGNILSLFGNGIPTYYFQIMVGLYVVEVVSILTTLANGIENGEDKLNENFLKGRNLVSTTITYVVLALIVTVIFNVIAGAVIGAGFTVQPVD